MGCLGGTRDISQFSSRRSASSGRWVRGFLTGRAACSWVMLRWANWTRGGVVDFGGVGGRGVSLMVGMVLVIMREQC